MDRILASEQVFTGIPTKTLVFLGLSMWRNSTKRLTHFRVLPDRLETNPGRWYATDPRATLPKIVRNRREGSYLGSR